VFLQWLTQNAVPAGRRQGEGGCDRSAQVWHVSARG